MTTQLKLNYKEYPECMFAMIAAFLPEKDGDEVRRAAGNVVFRSEDTDGNTYKNGLLHSFDDRPAFVKGEYRAWYKNGKRHRDGDLPAYQSGEILMWFKNGFCHREFDLPAYVSGSKSEYWYNGLRHRGNGLPALIDETKYEYW